MIDRENLRKNFLEANNIKISDIEELPNDCSFRRYFKIKNSKDVLLMDADPEIELKNESFINIANFLSANDLSAPKVIAQDLKNGFMLVEHLGEDSYNKLLSQNSDLEEKLYYHALDVLLKLQSLPVPDEILTHHSDEVLFNAVNLFINSYVSDLCKVNLSKKSKEEFKIIWEHLIPYTRQLPETTILYDYHVDNLIWINNRDNLKKVGILDFQDAKIGSPVYDIVSLLEDARRDVREELKRAIIIRYLNARPEISRNNFLMSYSIISVKRNLRIIGVFARKLIRDNNNSYLKFLPRVWKNIENNLKHPFLIPLKAWLNKNIPPEARKFNND